MYYFGTLIAALVPTFLVSRLFLRLSRSWKGGARRLIAVHFGSLVTISFVAGIGMADAGAFAGLDAVMIYIIPQVIWFAFDLARARNKAS